MEKTKIQMLYEACRVIFSQKELPTFKEILWLRNLIGMISSSLAYMYVMFVFEFVDSSKLNKMQAHLQQ